MCDNLPGSNICDFESNPFGYSMKEMMSLQFMQLLRMGLVMQALKQLVMIPKYVKLKQMVERILIRFQSSLLKNMYII